MMLDVFSVSPFLVFVVVLAMLWLLTRRHPLLPPGPPLLPFVGNALSMGSDTKVTFRNLRSKYGDIFSVYLFNKPVIVLNGYNVLKDALVKNADVFSDRPYTLLNDFISRGKGIIGTSGDVWREQRRFTLNTLREFGMGRNIMEDKIHEEISQFLAAIDEKMGQGFDCSRLVLNAVSNVICSIVFGKRFEYMDPLFVEFLKALEENSVLIGSSSVVNALPLVRFLPGDPFNFKKIVNNASVVETLLTQPSIKEHLKTHNDNDVQDFLGAYIKEIRHRQQQNEDTSMDFENLNRVIANLFVAGTETTATSIRWALVYFLNYPDVQEKCFHEIMENVGQGRRPSMKDKTNLPYVEATITEVLRHSNIVPANLPHTVPHDVQFRGYTFPKGILVIPNLDSVLRDNEIWGDADNFRPERFLNDDGKFQKKEEFIAFSLGRRVCLGEAMARMELFLFLTTMIQRFQFVPVNGQKPSMDGNLGLVHIPKPFLVKAVPRK